MAPNNNKKKNNKKNRNKNKKASSGGDGTGGNNNHNNIPIPTVPTAMTMPLTTKEITELDKEFELSGYKKSHDFYIGYRHYVTDQEDLAMTAFIRGTKNDGCVGCMFFGGHLQSKQNNMHLSLPLALEGAIRGHMPSIEKLISECYEKSEPEIPFALISFWMKMRNELYDDTTNEENRKNVKKHVANSCIVCGKEDSKEKTFEKCGICKFYSYCGKDCQTYHWKKQNHIAVCRHLKILREYCKPRHVKEIREAIIDGVDPKDIPHLQNLRTALGLNRPKEEYEELLLHLGDDSTIQDRYTYTTARKDGTVHIGSTPEAI